MPLLFPIITPFVVFAVLASRTALGRRLGFRRASSAGLGLALQQLATFVQPRAEHPIAFQLQEETDEDDSGDPTHPEAARLLLLRQARRIRQGTHQGPIVARLRP